jgi:hypothetical protein
MLKPKRIAPRFAMAYFSVCKARQPRMSVAEVRSDANISFNE